VLLKLLVDARDNSRINQEKEMMNTLETIKQTLLSGATKTRRLPLMALCAMLLSACASTATVTDQKKGEDDIVVERAEARWAALISKDLETAYGYYSPGYRSTTSLVDFVFKERTRRVKWESAEYLDHNCEDRTCKIRFKTGFRVDKAVPGMDVYHGSDEIEETWIKPDDEWWFVPPKG